MVHHSLIYKYTKRMKCLKMCEVYKLILELYNYFFESESNFTIKKIEYNPKN